jgi:signal transduction histidine kinase
MLTENIVRNALHYSPPGGKVTVAAERQGEEIRVVVRDQGPGVPEGELQAIFTPFYRGEERRDHSGYGLGLAIAQRVVSAHGGRISAYTRAEGGLCVEIALPAHAEPGPR